MAIPLQHELKGYQFSCSGCLQKRRFPILWKEGISAHLVAWFAGDQRLDFPGVDVFGATEDPDQFILLLLT